MATGDYVQKRKGGIFYQLCNHNCLMKSAIRLHKL